MGALFYNFFPVSSEVPFYIDQGSRPDSRFVNALDTHYQEAVRE